MRSALDVKGESREAKLDLSTLKIPGLDFAPNEPLPEQSNDIAALKLGQLFQAMDEVYARFKALNTLLGLLPKTIGSFGIALNEAHVQANQIKPLLAAGVNTSTTTPTNNTNDEVFK